MWKIFPLGELRFWAVNDDLSGRQSVHPGPGSGRKYEDASPLPTKRVPSGAAMTVPTVWELSPAPGLLAENDGSPSRMIDSCAMLVGLAASFTRKLAMRPQKSPFGPGGAAQFVWA